jgi:flagellar biosynthesis protein FliQ
MPDAKTQALIFVPLIVCAVAAIFFALGFLVTVVLQVPQKLNFPFSIRLIGLGMLMSGFLLFGWLLK